MIRRLPPVLVVGALLLAACGGDDDAAETTRPSTSPSTPPASAAPTPTEPPTTTATPPASTEPPTTTTTPVDPADLTAFAEPGPYPVGATTLQLPSGPLVEVWYPAVEGTTGTVTYDARDFTPEALEPLLTEDASATFSFEGARDVDVADGTFPVVLFSHGFTGFRLQSSFLTSHLASHGMIVVAPDHPTRDLENVIGEILADGIPSAPPTTEAPDTTDSPEEEAEQAAERAANLAETSGELLGALDLLVAENAVAGGRFEGRVDAERVAALGHSAGGGTILAAALDERVDGYVSMAAGGPRDDGDFPDRPSFFLAGATDEIVTPAERTRPAFEAAPPPTRYWEIEAAGHNAFDDFCTFGDGTGIIGVARASGLGPFLDAVPSIVALGEDGCLPPAAPVEQAFPIIRHGVTSWLRWLFEEDEEPVGIGPEVDGAYELGIVVEER
jgi:dienelactone hydrolase